MAMPHVDSLLMQGEEYDPAQVAYELAKIPAAIVRAVQTLSPRSSDKAYGGNVILPIDNQPFALLPYDRARVRSVIKVPSNTPAGCIVAIGDRSSVSGGNGYQLYPGDTITIETVAEVCAVLTGPVGSTVTISRWTELQAEPLPS